MADNAVILAIAEQLLNDSDDSLRGIDSDLEFEYREDELILSIEIDEKKQTLRRLTEKLVTDNHHLALRGKKKKKKEDGGHQSDQRKENQHHDHPYHSSASLDDSDNEPEAGSTSAKKAKVDDAETGTPSPKPKAKAKSKTSKTKTSKRKYTRKTNTSFSITRKYTTNKKTEPNSDEGDSEKPRSRYSYFEEVAKGMDDNAFKTRFGMTRETFEIVGELLRHKVYDRHVDFDTQLLCTLWFLGTQDSYKSTGERFKMGKSSVHFVVMRMCKELAALADDFICWPRAGQCPSMARKFKAKAGFPGVVGCVDDTYVPFKESTVKKTDSKTYVKVQCICDADMKFTYVCVQEPDGEGELDHTSELDQVMSKLGKQYHILGNRTYSLLPNLMTPYGSRDDKLAHWKTKYNDAHESTHSSIKQALGQLKIRFWRLKLLDMVLQDRASDLILACCVLQNIIIQHEGPLEMTYEEMQEVLGKELFFVREVDNQSVDRDAASKRGLLAKQL